MSSPVSKTAKRLTSRTASNARKRSVKAKSTRLKPATKRSPAGKARAHKAPKAAAARKTVAKRAVSKASTAKPRVAHPAKRGAKMSKSTPAHRANVKAALRPLLQKPLPPPPQPTFEEAAALTAFESAHKEFTRGRFAEARNQFRSLIDKYPTVSEVAARARTYLAVSEARLRTELTPPRDADSLYDRGVIELNRGEYVAAQELFERALKRDPDAAHIHYGLAATRARLGAIDTALKSLRRALDIQPKLRIRAQRDTDLYALRSDPEFDQIVFASAEA
jgi:tetratricopeptide (TPR) repeat protein